MRREIEKNNSDKTNQQRTKALDSVQLLAQSAPELSSSRRFLSEVIQRLRAWTESGSAILLSCDFGQGVGEGHTR